MSFILLKGGNVMFSKTRLAIKDINAIIEEKSKIDDLLMTTQRERDLKVKNIDMKYARKIDQILQKQKELEIILRDTKEYVKNI